MTALAFFRAAVQQQFAYRVANWAGLFTNCFFLFFRAYLLEACYVERAEIGGFTVVDAVTYATVSQAILMVIPQWGQVGVAAQVRSGQIATELLRPVDFFTMVLARRLGISAYHVAMRMGPVLLVGALAGLLAAPSWLALPMFVVSLVLGATIANTVLFLVELSSFWLESERGVRYLVLGASLLPSGLILPLAFFPDWLQTVCAALPFAYTLYFPVELWLGTRSGAEAWTGLGIQLAWAVGLILAARWGFARGTRRLLVVGG